MSDSFQSFIQHQKIILADGAMGTMLILSGLTAGETLELWNVDRREEVQSIHRAYIKAGAQVILTNSFGGHPLRLRMSNLEHRAYEVNRAAAELAREEADAFSGQKYVGGSMGPIGLLLEPYGDLTLEEARDGFATQAQALAEGGVDVLWIETMTDLAEVRVAIEGVRMSTELPFLATMSFEPHGRTMMGIRPEDAVEQIQELGAIALGANCGSGPEPLIDVISKMYAQKPKIPIVAKANAGDPELVNGEVVYKATPEEMARYAESVYQKGAKIIGACCGSKPAHIQAMAEALGI